MKKIYNLLPLLLLIFTLGFTNEKVSMILSDTSSINDPNEKITAISKYFKESPYKANTLIGNSDTKEELVIDLNFMDCFTFLDYVEALRLSTTPDEFVNNLKKVRYFNGEVEYKKRKHFFSDWVSGEDNNVKDITPDLPGSITVEKYINRRSDEHSWLKNLPQTMRMITYIPANMVTKEVLKMLKSGDYIGIYTDKEGLDVTHTGIFIRNKNGEFLRNTSSILGKVTDYPFTEYMENVKGIIVFRAK